jgi:hypothetical protein
MIERLSAMQKRAFFADEVADETPIKQRQNNRTHGLTPGISRAYP